MHPDELTIGDYLDNALSPEKRAEVESHLDQCRACRALVVDLRDLGQRVTRLEPLNPPARVWRRIEAAVEADARARADASAESPRDNAGRATLRSARLVAGLRSVPQWSWFASAAVIMIAAALGLRLWRAPGTPEASRGGEPAAITQPASSEILQAEEPYQKAISGLEQIVNAEKDALDPQTAATLDKSRAVVDQATSDSRAALVAQPGSEPARASLLANLKAKVELLQETVALINEMRKGNSAGAARIVSGINQKGN